MVALYSGEFKFVYTYILMNISPLCCYVLKFPNIYQEALWNYTAVCLRYMYMASSAIPTGTLYAVLSIFSTLNPTTPSEKHAKILVGIHAKCSKLLSYRKKEKRLHHLQEFWADPDVWIFMKISLLGSEFQVMTNFNFVEKYPLVLVFICPLYRMRILSGHYM
jgi:hypothetical protein